jgi:predicted small lipoprotein YifL
MPAITRQGEPLLAIPESRPPFTACGLPLTILPMRPLPALVAVALLIAGCGYKTPLVLPKPKPDEKASAQKPSPTEKEKKPENEP